MIAVPHAHAAACTRLYSPPLQGACTANAPPSQAMLLAMVPGKQPTTRTRVTQNACRMCRRGTHAPDVLH